MLNKQTQVSYKKIIVLKTCQMAGFLRFYWYFVFFFRSLTSRSTFVQLRARTKNSAPNSLRPACVFGHKRIKNER